MTNSNKVSIIVPAYNIAEYIEKCSETILQQTYSNIELIIVNDGSTDDTPKILEKIAQSDNRVIIIDKINGGVSSARNIALDRATGEYVMFVDGDDYIAKDCVEYMINLVKQTGADFCLSKKCYTKKDEPQTECEQIDIYSSEDATALLISPVVIVGCWNKIYRKKILDDNQIRFSTSLYYGEGLTFITEVAQKVNCVGVGNRKVYYYRRNNVLSATTKFNIESLRNGQIALEGIEKNINLHNNKISTMLMVHKCNYCIGAMVRIRTHNCLKEYISDYMKWQNYLHRNTFKLLFKKRIGMYRKMLFIVGCICPQVLVRLDVRRRKQIVKNSI